MRRLLPAALRRFGDRGSAEVGVVLVAGAVVAGSVLGTGVARTAVEVTDGITWLADSPSGRVVEVDPQTLQPQATAQVGAPGQQLVLSQDRGRLVVSNTSTGSLTSIDLATLLASGRRDAAPGGSVSVILDHGRAFLVDRRAGLVANIDPVTLATRGRVWMAPGGLRDAVADRSGAIWVAAGDGTLTRLTWSDASLAFVPGDTRTLERVGDAVRLVAHERGVTVVSPSTGAILQVGTGHDLVGASPQMRGRIAPASRSDSDLVPVSVPDRDVVVIVRDGRVVEVSTASLGCPDPGTPAELGGVVYVPCPTTGRVIRLEGDGRKAGPDILTGTKGTPELVVDDGTLLVNVQGSPKGVRVSSDGTTSSFTRLDPTMPPTDVDRRHDDGKDAHDKAKQDRKEDRDQKRPDPPRWDPGAGTLPTKGPEPTPTVTTTRPTGGKGNGGGTQGGPDRTPEPTPTPTGTVPPPPVDPVAPVITAVAPAGAGRAAVSWTQPGPRATGYEVLVDGAVAARVGGTTTSATLTGLGGGTTVTVVVRATFPDGSTLSSAAGQVTAAGAPGAPTALSATETARTRTSVTFAVSWGAAPEQGSPVTGYALAASGDSGSDSWSGTGRSASVTVPCPGSTPACGSVRFSVTARNGVGTGPAATTTAGTSTAPQLGMPGAGATVVAGQSTDAADDEFDLDRTTTLTIAPPGDWAGFSGTCQLLYTGATSGPSQVPCSGGQVQVQVSRGTDMLRRSTHKVTMRAVDPAYPGSPVDSATYTWSLVWPISDPCGTNGKICP